MTRVSLSQAWDLLCDAEAFGPGVESEHVPLEEAQGRIASRDLAAPWPVPVRPQAGMDGYAVAAGTCRRGEAYPVAGELVPGVVPEAPLSAGQAWRVMTGAFLPDGADAVVPVESVQETEDGRVLLRTDPVPGEHVIPRARFFREGQRLLCAGQRITPQDVGNLATFGFHRVAVWEPLEVAILTLGSELREVREGGPPGTCFNSNAYHLAAWIQTAGGKPRVLPVAPDAPDAVRTALESAMVSPLVITTGGTAKGRYDFVKRAVLALGGEIFWDGMRVSPGSTGALSHISGVPVVSLPGTAAAVAPLFHALVKPLFLRLAGANFFRPRPVPVRLGAPVRKAPGVTKLSAAVLVNREGTLVAEPSDNVQAVDGYLLLPEEAEALDAGTLVDCLLTAEMHLSRTGP